MQTASDTPFRWVLKNIFTRSWGQQTFCKDQTVHINNHTPMTEAVVLSLENNTQHSTATTYFSLL